MTGEWWEKHPCKEIFRHSNVDWETRDRNLTACYKLFRDFRKMKNLNELAWWLIKTKSGLKSFDLQLINYC